MGDLETTGLAVGLPGFQDLFGLIDGGLEEKCRLYMQKRGIIEEYRRIYHEYIVSYVERTSDSAWISNDRSFRFANTSVTRVLDNLSLPTLKKITRMVKEADIPSHLHSCGVERYVVEVAAKETELSSIDLLSLLPEAIAI